MNNVSKKLPLIVSLISALSLACISVHQTGVINDLKQELKQTFKRLGETQQLLEEEMELSETLRTEIHELEDSIEVLHVEIAHLNEKITIQKSTIRKQNMKMKKLDDEVNGLTKRINFLSKNNAAKEQQIKNLEIQRDEILLQMETIDRDRSKMKNKLKKQEAAVATNKLKKQKMQREIASNEKQIQNNKVNATNGKSNAAALSLPPSPEVERKEITQGPQQERMNKIVTATNVKISSVTLKNKENGRAISKLNSQGWRYTIVDFDMGNADREAIMDKEFILQLFDIDNGKVVPVNESNPNFPESSQGAIGYRFTYNGKPMTISYFNSQKKTGTNYEIRMYYAKKGFMIPLRNGKFQIVENGLVVKS